MKFKTFLFFGLCAFGLCTEKVQAMTLETVPITYQVMCDLFWSQVETLGS